MKEKNVYKVDFRFFYTLLLPTLLRKKVFIIAFLEAASQPFRRMHAMHATKRAVTAGRLQYTGQVCYMRGMLNDKFDPIKRRVRITHADERLHTVLHKRAENKPIMVPKRGTANPILINSRESISIASYFTVWLPNEQYYVERKDIILAHIEQYRLATRYPEIKYLP